MEIADAIVVTPFTRKEERTLPAVQAPANTTPMQMIALAVANGEPIEKLEKLMALQERFEANEARKAFVVALAAFKVNPPDIHKNKHVEFTSAKGTTSYDHATLDQVSVTIGKALGAHGLSHRWNVEQIEAGMIRVTCILTHSLGHSERVAMQAGRDDTGNKNNIQQLGSTVSYLQRYTLLSATGMAVKGQDNDGRKSEKAAEEVGMPEKGKADHLAAIDAASTDNELQEAYLKALEGAKAARDKVAQREFIGAKEIRKAALAKKVEAK